MPKSPPSQIESFKSSYILLILAVLSVGVTWLVLEIRSQSSRSDSATALKRYQQNQPLMGTMASVTVYAPSAELAEVAIQEAFARGEEINQVASDYLPDSELSRFNAAEVNVWIPASVDFLTMVAQGLELAELTNSAYDPTFGTLTQLWRESKASQRRPSAKTLDESHARSGRALVEVDLQTEKIRKLKKGVRLDLGGLAKGYAADQMLAIVGESKITSALILVGGDVRCGLAPPEKKGWSVGLINLQNELTFTVTVEDCAVSTSGDSQQFVEIAGQRYSHIIDPATGLGLTDSLLATVIAPNGLMADPLATAACVDPTFFRDLPPSTEVHSRILSISQKQISAEFPTLEPYQGSPTAVSQ